MGPLDHASLLQVAGSLPDVKDLLSLQTTCRELEGVCGTSVLWSRFLERDFDLCFADVGSVELQTAFRQLATVECLHPVRFAGAYTDGGYDNQDMRYWIDHAFLPNNWSPHCSDSPFDIHLVGLLRVQPQPYDVAALEHRAFLIDRCKWAAALLFGAANQMPDVEAAIQKLRAWSTAGLERLFSDLYEDLTAEGGFTWGRLLLKDNGRKSEAETRHLLVAKYADIQNRALEQHFDVQQVPAGVAAAALAAGAANGGGGSSSSAAAVRGRSPDSARFAASTCLVQQLAPAPAGAVISSAATQQQQQQQQQGSGGDGAATLAVQGAASPPVDLHAHPHLAPSALKRYDAKQMGWFQEEAMQRSTAVVSELVVSRWGHFTCPVACGAIFMAQLPNTTTTTATSSSGSGTAAGSAAGLAASGAGPSASNSASQPQGAAAAAGGSDQPDACMAGLQQLVGVSDDPYCAALKGRVTSEAVLAASAAGQLPPVVQHVRTSGTNGEWVEFGPLTEQQRRERAACGWHWRPVVWFRFPKEDLLGEVAAQAAAFADGLAAAAEEAEADGDVHMEDATSGGSSSSEEGDDADLDAEGEGGSDSDSGSSYATARTTPSPEAAEVDDAAGTEEGSEMTSPVGTQEDQQQEAASSGGDANTGLAVMAAAGASGEQSDEQQEAAGPGPQRWWNHIKSEEEVEEYMPEEEEPGGVAAALMSDPFQETLPGRQVDWSLVAARQDRKRQAEDTRRRLALPPHLAAAQGRSHGLLTSTGSSSTAAAAAVAEPAEAAAPRSSRSSRQQQPSLTVAPPPALIQACHRVPAAVSDVAARKMVQMPLSCLRSGNALALKLITSEDNMAALGDLHEVPNIDVQFVMAKGCVVTFAPGSRLL